MTARDVWAAAFLVLMFITPVLRLLSTEQQTLARELVTISGLLATALLAMTIILPTRLRSVTRAFGIESVMLSHRFLGTATALLAMSHIGLIIATDPEQVALLIPMDGMPPWRALMGSLATVCIALLVLLAAYRRGRYENWRGWHVMLTWVAAVAVGAHILLIGHLLRTDPPDLPSAAFLIALGAVVLGMEIWRWGIRPLSRKSAYRVVGTRAISDNTSIIRVRPARRSEQGPRFLPGQFAWIRLRRVPLFSEEHPFTVSSGVQDRPTIEFTVRHNGDWTETLRALRAGDALWLDGPHGSLTPRPNPDGIVLIAGGVGVTPMMSILRSMRDRPRTRTSRSLRLILVDRPGQGLFRRELASMQSDLHLQLHEMHGEVTAERLVDLLPPQWLRTRLDYFLCGPPSLVNATAKALRDLRIPSARIHTERFEI